MEIKRNIFRRGTEVTHRQQRAGWVEPTGRANARPMINSAIPIMVCEDDGLSTVEGRVPHRVSHRPLPSGCQKHGADDQHRRRDAHNSLGREMQRAGEDSRRWNPSRGALPGKPVLPLRRLDLPGVRRARRISRRRAKLRVKRPLHHRLLNLCHRHGPPAQQSQQYVESRAQENQLSPVATSGVDFVRTVTRLPQPRP